MGNKLKPLWRCPKCGERFVTRNMWHSCGKQSIKALFSRSEPQVFKLFTKFAKMVKACGPVRVIPQKSRVVFQVRVRFAGCHPRKSYLHCGIALGRKHKSSRFVKVVVYSPHFIGHEFRVYSEEDLGNEVQDWIRESYEIGKQARSTD